MMKRLSGELQNESEHSSDSTTLGASRSSDSQTERGQIDVDKCLRVNSTCYSTASDNYKSFDLTSVVEEETEELLEKKSSQLKSASKKITKKRRDLQVSTSKGRKTKGQMKLLLSYFHLYKGKWDDELFGDLVEKTGFNKKQLNKWFWDRKKKVSEAISAKKQSYPGLIFEVTNMETGMDLTPTFKRMCVNKPIFIVEKVQN
uniref:Homeobox domain-containing protein n=1 Tax=Strombidium inclinatum TaxID=197538 RepID=A0A7S3IHP1_9SPIT|mmetsp:Transcript_1962/g.2905  ORF Transcript_1962/g.2905 Transcript_1962/m.2905 type:complete len:202 (+) Transcript_1962:419-1024(+)